MVCDQKNVNFYSFFQENNDFDVLTSGMQHSSDNNLRHWTTRITLKRHIQDEIRHMARDEMRSMASMIGVLLGEAVTARSS